MITIALIIKGNLSCAYKATKQPTYEITKALPIANIRSQRIAARLAREILCWIDHKNDTICLNEKKDEQNEYS